MVAHVETVAFQGVEARPVDVQVHMAGGVVGFAVVGLGDKAVAESRERVRAALQAIGLGLPAKRITVNLAPADLPKEGSHYDLPIALGLLVAMGVLPPHEIERYVVIGELSLDGTIAPVAGALPAAIAANAKGKGLICPLECGPEAAWAGMGEDNPGGVLAPRSIIALVNHFRGTQIISEPAPLKAVEVGPLPDLRDIKGQETAKRALEVAAAGGHNMLMVRSMYPSRCKLLFSTVGRMAAILLAAIVLCIGEGTGIAPAVAASASISGTAYAIDGDTIRIEGEGKVRLQGVAAPERNEQGGTDATNFMKRLVNGKDVRCELDGSRTYDRRVGVCFLEGNDIGEAIIAAGLARDCPRYSGGRYRGVEQPDAAALPFPGYCAAR